MKGDAGIRRTGSTSPAANTPVLNKGLLRKTGSGSAVIKLANDSLSGGSAFINDGEVRIEGGGGRSLQITGGSADGGKYVVGSGASLSFDGQRTIGGLVLDGGTLEQKAAGNHVHVDGTFEVSGESTIKGDGGDLLTRTGGTTILAGTLSFKPLQGGIPMSWQNDGTLQGSGTIDMGSGVFVNQGWISPGGNEEQGRITLRGKLELGNQSKLRFDIGSAASDELEITNSESGALGRVALGGYIEMQVLPGYTAQTGDVRRLIAGPPAERTSGLFGSRGFGTGLGDGGLTFDLGDPVRLVIAGGGARLFTNEAGAANANTPALDRQWQVAANWRNDAQPAAGETALLDAASARPILHGASGGGPTEIGKLVLTPGTPLTIAAGTLKIDGPVEAGEATLQVARGATGRLNGAATIRSLILDSEDGSVATLAGTGSLVVKENFSRGSGSVIGDGNSYFGSVNLRQVDGDLVPGPMTVAGPITLTTVAGFTAAGDVIIRAPVISNTQGLIKVTSAGALKVEAVEADRTAELRTLGAMEIVAAAGVSVNGGVGGRAQLNAVGNMTIEAASLTLQGHTGTGPIGSADARVVSGATQTITLGDNASLTAGDGSGRGAAIVAPVQRISVGGDLTLQGGGGSTFSGARAVIGAPEPVSLMFPAAVDLELSIGGALNLQAGSGGVAARIGPEGGSTANGSLLITAGGNLTLGHVAGAVEQAGIGLPGGVGGNLAVSLKSTGGNINLDGSVRAGGVVRIVTGTAGDIRIGSLGQVISSATGDAIVIAADGKFANAGGSTSLQATAPGGAGRWLVYAGADPDYHDRGGLSYDFKHYGQTYDPAVSYAGPGTGNGFLYRVSPELFAAVSGSAVKTYDRQTGAPVVGLQAQVSDGVIDNDVVTLTPTSATFADRFVGSAKGVDAVVSLNSAFSAEGKPVYGYRLGPDPVPVQGPGTREITPRPLAATGVSAQNRAYDGTTNVTLTGGVLDDVISGDTVTLTTGTGSIADKNVGTVRSVTASGFGLSGADAGNYTLSAQPSGLTVDITAKALTVTGVTAASRVYDRTTVAGLSGSPALDGVVAGDDVVLDPSQMVGNFADPNVGTDKPVLLSGLTLTGLQAGNYTLTPQGASASIWTKGLSLVSNTATAVPKVYDGTTSATLGTSPTLGGVIAGDSVEVDRATVTALFSNRDVGQGKSVSFTVTGLTGPGAGNYSLAMNTTIGTGTITAKPLAVTGISALDKVYDGSTAASLVGTPTLLGAVGNDAVQLDASGLSGGFFDRNVGSGKPVGYGGLSLTGAAAGNYTLDGGGVAFASITARTLTLSGASALDKVYDGTTAATLAGGTLSGVIVGDRVNLSVGVGSFADRNVGTGKLVSASFGLEGADAGNYALQQPGGLSASITARPLTVGGLSAADRVYDGTTAASLSGTPALQGAVSGDAVGLDAAQLRGSFADRNVGPNKPVTIVGLALTGSAAGNYTLSAAAGVAASITARPLTITGLSAADKVYDGTTVATVRGTPQLEGAIANDALVLDVSALSASFADRNVGSAKAVSIGGLALSGADAGNYALAQGNLGLKAGITARTLTVSGLTVSDKVYDGTTTATVSTPLGLQGAIAGDAIELDASGLRATFADRNVGQGKTVSVGGLALRGADVGNYALSVASATTASITPRSLETIELKVADRVYDGTAAASLTGGGLRGVLEGDAVSLDTASAQASFADRGAGAAKAVTITGLRLAGNDAGNYRLSADGASASATIAQRPLTLLPSAADRVYDGTTAARVQVADDRIEGDRFSIGYAAAFADRHVGTDKPVTISAITLTGPDAANYRPPSEGRASAAITVRPTATWAAQGSGDWMVAGNWDALPDRGNVAAVSIPAGVQVSYDGSTPVTLASLANAGSLVLRGAGLEAARLDNAGRLVVAPGAAIDLTGRSVLGSGTLVNEGTLGLSASTVANRLENAGNLRLNGDNSLASVANAGAAVLQGGVTTLSGAWSQTAGSTVQSAGASGVASRLVASGGVRIEGGRLSGSGWIVGDLVVNAGEIAPGASPGSVDVAGSVLLGESSTLQIELGGTAPGTYDTVSASGALTLAGRLQISSYGGFVPKASDTFRFLSGASVSGLFADVTASGPELAALSLRNMQVGVAQGVVSLPSAALVAEAALIAQTQLAGATVLQPGSALTTSSTSMIVSTMSSAASPTGASVTTPEVSAPGSPPLNSTGTETTSSASGRSSSSGASSTSGSSSSSSSAESSPSSGSESAAPASVRRTVLRSLDLPDAPEENTRSTANREVSYTGSTASPSGSGPRRSGC
jgi:hypothetical protein